MASKDGNSSLLPRIHQCERRNRVLKNLGEPKNPAMYYNVASIFHPCMKISQGFMCIHRLTCIQRISKLCSRSMEDLPVMIFVALPKAAG